VLLALIASTGGCGLLNRTIQLPGKVVSAAEGGDKKAPPVDPKLVQSRFMRYTDVFAVEIGRSTAEFAALAGTQDARIQALTWKLEYTTLMWRLSTSQRPFAGLFDGIIAVTALRLSHEEEWLAKWGDADRPMLDSLVMLEKSVWDLADEALNDAQMKQVHAVVDHWLAGDKEHRITDITRLPGFVDTARAKGEDQNLFADLGDLVSIDPLGGLEPAVREVAEARQLAERAFFFLQHMPDLLSTRIELLALRSSQTEPVQLTLASVERVSEAAKSIAATAAALPADVRAERETAIAQISAEIDAQRAGLVHDLETARAPLVELLEKSRGTLEAGKTLSDSLKTTIEAVDVFMARFPPEEKVPGQPEPPPGRPFDITEYGAAAERIGVAVRELGTTIETLDKSLPQVQRALDEAAARGERTVDHVFERAYWFLGLALAGILAVILLVRWISPRLRAHAKT
jgi:hypothetical protein